MPNFNRRALPVENFESPVMSKLTCFSRLAIAGLALSSSLTLPILRAEALTVTVKCDPPNPGTYSLGWGSSRLIIPTQGRPYIMFRGKRTPVNDKICKAGDNSGAILFRADGTVWGYIQLQN